MTVKLFSMRYVSISPVSSRMLLSIIKSRRNFHGTLHGIFLDLRSILLGGDPAEKIAYDTI